MTSPIDHSLSLDGKEKVEFVHAINSMVHDTIKTNNKKLVEKWNIGRYLNSVIGFGSSSKETVSFSNENQVRCPWRWSFFSS